MKNEKEVISKDYQLNIENLNSEIKNGKHELIKLKDEYEKRIEKNAFTMDKNDCRKNPLFRSIFKNIR